MSNIPRARDHVIGAIQVLEERPDEIKFAVSLLNNALRLMVREPPVRKAKRSSVKATKNLKTAIKLYAGENPKASLTEIARTFSVNMGRVSEALKK